MRKQMKRAIILSGILAGAFSLYSSPMAGATPINKSGTDIDLVGIENSSTNNLESITVTVTSSPGSLEGHDVIGIHVDDAHSYTNTMITPGTISVTITGAHGGANGLITENDAATGTSASTLTGATDITVTGVGDSNGVVAEGNDNSTALAASNSINAGSSAATGKLTVKSTGNSATGIRAYNYGKNTIGGLTDIIVEGSNEGRGIEASNHSSNEITMAASGGNIKVTGSGYVSGVATFDDTANTITNLANLTVEMTGQMDEGMSSAIGSSGGTTNITMVSTGGEIKATATKAPIVGIASGAAGTTTINNLAKLSVESPVAIGITTSGNEDESATQTTLNMLSSGGDFIVKGTGEEVMGILANDDNSVLTINNLKNMEITNTDGIAIGIDNGGNNTVNINGISPDVSTIKASGSYGQVLAYASKNGTINLTNVSATMDTASARSYAIYANIGEGNVNLNNSIITGRVAYDADPANTGETNALNISLTNNSILTGVTAIEEDHGTKNPKLNMDIDGTSTWNVPGESLVTTLTNNGKVAFLQLDSGFSKLTVTTLNGVGTYAVNTDLAKNTGDAIAVGTSNNATANIMVAYDPVYKGASKDTVLSGVHRVLTVDSGSSSITVNPLTTDWGSIRFTPTIRDNGDGTFDITALTGKEKFDPSENTMTAADARAVVDEAWFSTVNSLSKRMGDLRMNEKDADGVWARFQRNNNKMKGGRQAKLNANLYQVGYDKAFARKNGTTYVGLGVDHVSGNGSYENGGGDVKGTSVALYDTWIGNSGHYYDIILRRGHFSNDYTVRDLSGTVSDADYGTNATTLSGEYGYRKNFTNGSYVEPQAEIIAAHLSGAGYTTSTGWPVNVDGYNHFITRLGVAVGRQNKKSNYYAKASCYHDFAGGGEIKFDTLTYERDKAKNWGELTLGGDMALTKSSRLYGEITKLIGDRHNSLNYNVGFMFNF